MIDDASLIALIRGNLPDAQVEIVDRTGTRDHFNVAVRSKEFADKTLLEQHRLVYDALGTALRDGRIHAVELKTEISENSMSEQLRDEIAKEIAANKILVYGKGTKTAPRCGFTLETIEFFNHFGYPFEVVDVLENMPKREALSEMTSWPTLPKVFIDGTFYGDTDTLGPMHQKGELEPLLGKAFGAEPAPVIKLH